MRKKRSSGVVYGLFLFVALFLYPCLTEAYVSFFGSSPEYRYMQKHSSKKYASRRVLVMRDFFRLQNPSVSAKAAKIYAALTERICRKYDVDPFLVAAIIVKESTVQVGAKSGIAYGLMQINWEANKKWIPRIFPTIKSRRDLLHSRPNIYVGTYMLREALRNAGGNVDHALDRYRGKSVTSYRQKIHAFYVSMTESFKKR
ncbi:MAG TPA: transglycosylase SLT domain-containing protein [Synergistaceae bacterium]|nr:transglycosylase SLT domain-containing protein [Synergistaceae bacterium]HPJ24939.1 transglycosylase SLT domain-containing protein [Synergistaceae bacterium]HPQ37857.1 transglycosylase SLT domain-containing protein [Synergistaceae bacterium]